MKQIPFLKRLHIIVYMIRPGNKKIQAFEERDIVMLHIIFCIEWKIICPSPIWLGGPFACAQFLKETRCDMIFMILQSRPCVQYLKVKIIRCIIFKMTRPRRKTTESLLLHQFSVNYTSYSKISFLVYFVIYTFCFPRNRWRKW